MEAFMLLFWVHLTFILVTVLSARNSYEVGSYSEQDNWRTWPLHIYPPRLLPLCFRINNGLNI